MAVAPRPGQAGRDGSQALLEVAVSSGQIVRQLTPLPAQALFTANTLMGTEGTITADPGGHYLLIATAGPDGHGEIFRWTVGTHQLVPSPAARSAPPGRVSQPGAPRKASAD